MSKREDLREKRRKDQLRQRIILISVIAVVVVAVAAIIVVPKIVESATPVGNIVKVTPGTFTQTNKSSMGSPTAKVQVEEFADYQCPYCKDFHDKELKNLIDQFVTPGKVIFTYSPVDIIDPPNDTALESTNAANAAYCAADQNKFFEISDVLYGNQGPENSGIFLDKRIKAMGALVPGLDQSQFSSCIDSHKYDTQVSGNLATFENLGLTATPSFVITVDGKVVQKTSQYSDLLTLVQQAVQGQ